MLMRGCEEVERVVGDIAGEVISYPGRGHPKGRAGKAAACLYHFAKHNMNFL